MKTQFFAGLALALSLLAPAFSAAGEIRSRRAGRSKQVSDKGPPLIFIPGLASGRWVWTDTAAAAAKASTPSIY